MKERCDSPCKVKNAHFQVKLQWNHCDYESNVSHTNHIKHKYTNKMQIFRKKKFDSQFTLLAIAGIDNAEPIIIIIVEKYF